MSDDVTVLIFETSTRAAYSPFRGQIGFGTAEPPVTARFFGRQMKSGDVVRHATQLGRHDLQRAARSGIISFKASSMLNQTFATPGLARALLALDHCVADLLVAWGSRANGKRNSANSPSS